MIESDKKKYLSDYPQLVAEWHPTKNGDLTPDTVLANSGKMFWWQCSKGHEWKAIVSNRKRRGSGCPFCTGRKAIAGENDLATLHPEIAAEWHPTLNGERLPSEFTTYSNYKAWWRCEEGHEWESLIFNRSLGRGCRICGEEKRKKTMIANRIAKTGSLLDHNPTLSAEWHPTKNGDLLPSQVLPFSTIEVWWRCKEGHEWKAIVQRRNRGTGCPYCANKLKP